MLCSRDFFIFRLHIPYGGMWIAIRYINNNIGYLEGQVSDHFNDTITVLHIGNKTLLVVELHNNRQQRSLDQSPQPALDDIDINNSTFWTIPLF